MFANCYSFTSSFNLVTSGGHIDYVGSNVVDVDTPLFPVCHFYFIHDIFT